MAIQHRHTDEGTRDDRKTRAFTSAQVAQLVIENRDGLTVQASRHPDFDGLSLDDIEELFDSATEMVLDRHDSYADLGHIRASLWTGMRYRARDLFRRRRRRELLLEDLEESASDPVAHYDDRVAQQQMLLIVRDFLAAMTVREAEVWKLVHGEELSVVATSRRLGISRHAVKEHLDAATRKLATFTTLMNAGAWCGRRETDILRMLDGIEEPGTLRRAFAHLDACSTCRHRNAHAVRSIGRSAAGILPLPVLAAEGAAGLFERILGLLPQFGSGSGRTEAVGSALLGGGGGIAGLAKAGAVVATTATVAVGVESATTSPDKAPPRGADAKDAVEPRRPTVAQPRLSAGSVLPAPTATPAPRRRAKGSASSKPTKRPQQRTVVRPQSSAPDETFALGTVEPTPVPPARVAAAETQSPPATGSGETFLP